MLMKKKKNILFTKRTITYLVVMCVGILLFMALSNIGAVLGVIGTVYSIINPFVIGLAIAYILNMPMSFFERTLFSKLKKKRGVSILTTYLLAIFLLGLMLSFVMPEVIDSIVRLVNNLPEYAANINLLLEWVGTWAPIGTENIESLQVSYTDIINSVLEWLRSIQSELIDVGVRIGSGIISGAIGTITAFIASIYMLGSKEKLIKQSRRVMYALLSKKHADRVMQIGKLSDKVFSGFISGKILDSAIIGLLCFGGLSLMSLAGDLFGISALQMQYTVLISTVIGVTNIIPFFGPLIGAVPCALILLIANPWSALWFGVFVLVLQQFDGNILGPKILGESTGLPAIWVLIAIIVGGGLFGFTGMLLGVPVTAVLYTLISEFVENRLRKKGLADDELSFAEQGAEFVTVELDENVKHNTITAKNTDEGAPRLPESEGVCPNVVQINQSDEDDNEEDTSTQANTSQGK